MESDSSSSSSLSEYPTLMAMRHRHVVSAAASAAVGKREKTGRKLRVERKNWLYHVSRLGPRNFKRMYRMDIISFNHLHNVLHKELETIHKEQAIRSSGSAVCSHIRLALTIRYLAGGSLWGHSWRRLAVWFGDYCFHCIWGEYGNDGLGSWGYGFDYFTDRRVVGGGSE